MPPGRRLSEGFIVWVGDSSWEFWLSRWTDWVIKTAPNTERETRRDTSSLGRRNSASL